MNRTFGEIKPFEDGLLAPVKFVQLAKMDERTSDGRKLNSDGGNVRTLPRTGFVQFAQGPGGHVGSEALIRLDMVEFEGNIVSGHGWLVDTDQGRLAYQLMKLGILRHNSADLADTKYDLSWSEADDSIHIDFTQWSVAGTTITGLPAFPDTDTEVGELMASFVPADLEIELTADGAPMEIEFLPETWSVRLPSEQVATEVTADLSAAAKAVPAAPFFRPEADGPTALTIDENGHFWGHLGDWNKPHGAFLGRPRYISRSANGYSSIMKPGPLVEFEDGRRAIIDVAPIFLYNGHVTGQQGKDQAAIEEAYGSVENTWGHYRIHDGKFGPWICGMMKPHITEAQAYDARCAPISGHWLSNDLRAVVSVNVPGYEVAGQGKTQYLESVDDDGALELVAVLGVPVDTDHVMESGDTPRPTAGTFEISQDAIDRITGAVVSNLEAQFGGRLAPLSDETPTDPPASLADIEAARRSLLGEGTVDGA